jgi:S-formylglutathione hydrolase FrmB
MKKLTTLSIIYFLIHFSCLNAAAQNGTIVADSLYAKSLEKNFTGENPERHVTIYLPPSYKNDNARHYPVVYLLHGLGGDASGWLSKDTTWDIGHLMNIGIRDKHFGEMIIVMPGEDTKWFGSFYVNSAATGNWEDFTVSELVNYVDKKYRTIANAQNRAIAGVSMGGYGAITLAMKHPEVFSIVYGMSPALIQFSKDISPETPSFQRILHEVLTAKSPQELLKGSTLSVGMLTLARAFSPDAADKVFFADYPFKIENNRIVPSEPAYSNWEKNFPVEMVKSYRENLKKLKAIKFDVGFEDEFQFIPVACKEFSDKLSAYDIDHVFEEYNGAHANLVLGPSGRLLNEVLPFIWFNFPK